MQNIEDEHNPQGCNTCSCSCLKKNVCMLSLSLPCYYTYIMISIDIEGRHNQPVNIEQLIAKYYNQNS